MKCTTSSIAALLFLAPACGDGSDKKDDSGKPIGPDLTERLSEGEVRAGVVTDDAALFGGAAAEGALGDIKIYNDRVQFIIEAAGESQNYVEYGGSLVDLDIVRPEGQLGQDLIDDASTMVGLGRMFDADTVTVLNDGTNGEAAHVRAVGSASPLTIMTGTLEAPALIAERTMTITTDYRLQPDSHLLQMDTRIDWADEDTTVQVTDFMFTSADVSDAYQQQAGYTSEVPDSYGWTGIVGQRHEVAVAILEGKERDAFIASAVLESLFELGPLILGTTESTTLSDGDVFEWTRYVGVGSDLASITDDWHTVRGDATDTVAGVVTAGGEAVEAARVHILDASGKPITMAQTDASGTFSALVPSGSAVTAVAEARGPGVYYDREPGAGWLGPYNAPTPRAAALESMAAGATPIPFPAGHGLSEPQGVSEEMRFELSPPAMLTVNVAGGVPAMVRVDFADADPVTAIEYITPGRPSGRMAWLYLRDGEGTVPVEPGDYTVVVARGPTHEAHVESVSVAAGETHRIDATLEASVDTEGFWSLDPHSHAAPSGDGSIPMSGRLTVHAAHHVDVHFGTDHDHVVDYRPLLEPLGLSDHLVSIVSDEVSPTRRGHHNVYPVEVRPDATNGGAFIWSRTFMETWSTTEELFDQMRAMASDGEVIVQANHPTGSSGLFTASNYRPAEGRVRSPDRWAGDFEAFEILNDGNYSRVFPYYLDLLNRGLNPTPVGVSDSHSHRGGAGENRTWVPLDAKSTADFTNDHVREAIRSAGTISSLGPLVVPTIDGQWAPGTTHTDNAEVTVEVRAPSWIQVDTLHVWENGTEVQTLPIVDNLASVLLDPEADAVYVLTVTGETDMSPVYPGEEPWAVAQGIFIDVGGDGWTPPLPPLRID